MTGHFKYEELVQSEEDNSSDISNLHPCVVSTKWWRIPFLSFIVGGALLAGATGFMIGKHVQQHSLDMDWFSPPDDVRITYDYQRQFADRPNNSTQDPWTEIMAPANGFIQHPSISAELHGVSVFHQLHCLNAIRRAYWAAIDGIPISHVSRPAHVRHCIDYLRQSLMCHADTNLEPVIKDLGGVTGFGSEHKCRDFEKVKEWVGAWAPVISDDRQ
ncbi:hypothetical protein F5B22DRAFT_644815 [Xylaria bambusicola]|uniref:uncharacterized protein n=1 Tax=Xylaria bambusicola TaxID=326684 RepID=UPI0020084E45|nr:uncharacterized protein F5B22DRAFT_644815 [Xylaria bambusicola]KAI0518510.1 hypothetical protein F5B22DRAFT_644815 [Xylaria bambusicola]